MTEKVDRTFICDLSGREIEDVCGMLRVTLDRAQTIRTMPGRQSETVHIHPDEHNIKHGNSEAREWDIIAYVSESGEIPLITLDHGMHEQYFGGDEMPTEWRELADRIETEVLR